MSVALMQEVWWHHLGLSGGKLLLMLALADNADEVSRACWPSVPYLARKTRMSDRQVYRLLLTLEREGRISVRRGAGPKRTSVFTLSQDDKLSDCHGVRVTSETPDPDICDRNAPCSGSGSGRRNRQEPSGAPRAVKRLLPEPFELTEAGEQFALAGGLTDVRLIFGAFKDHHRAKGSKFVDWQAAWRTWCRNEHKFRSERVRR